MSGFTRRGFDRSSLNTGQPATQATMHATLAQAYASLGAPVKAREGFERAIIKQCVDIMSGPAGFD